MIIKNVDEGTSLVIVKTFEIQSCVGVFRTFQYSQQPKLGKVLNARNEDELFSLVHDRYAVACKDKNRKIVGHVTKYVPKPIHFFIKYGGRVKVMVNDKKQYSEFYNKKCYTDLKNILKMSCQRNENSLVNQSTQI